MSNELTYFTLKQPLKILFSCYILLKEERGLNYSMTYNKIRNFEHVILYTGGRIK